MPTTRSAARANTSAKMVVDCLTWTDTGRSTIARYSSSPALAPHTVVGPSLRGRKRLL
ncbi:hypothetical protein [Streptomyces pratensis]|uniref:hypothetical protein n=1 Tax=Streptomyces pratensis TaxID=1169025 RepID=UPI00363F491C